ncbi:MAG: lipoprotein signal peptidase [Deltaproteobacteria bacterium]|nr:lipoprotein signal peptidase [Deltaproteobacteria bacterium]
MSKSESESETETVAAPETDVSRATNPHRQKWQLFAIVSILSLVADQATKIWARASLPVVGHGTGSNNVCVVPDDIMTHRCAGKAVEVIDSFWHWRLSMNPGSAFGLFSGQGSAGRIMLSIVGILAVGGMIWMLRKARPDQRILHWALALVAGGAVGNLIDRIYYGVVTDFVLWKIGPYDPVQQRFEHEWPVFNVADVVLVIGVGLMFLDIQKEGKRDKAKKKKRQDKAKAAGLVKHL